MAERRPEPMADGGRQGRGGGDRSGEANCCSQAFIIGPLRPHQSLPLSRPHRYGNHQSLASLTTSLFLSIFSLPLPPPPWPLVVTGSSHTNDFYLAIDKSSASHYIVETAQKEARLCISGVLVASHVVHEASVHVTIDGTHVCVHVQR